MSVRGILVRKDGTTIEKDSPEGKIILHQERCRECNSSIREVVFEHVGSAGTRLADGEYRPTVLIYAEKNNG